MAKVTFNNKNSVFYDSLKTKVDAYFKTKNIARTGNIHLFIKTLVLVPLAVGIYYTLLFIQPSTIPSLLLCGVLGLTLASIGFNVMHDACHGSYSSRKWVNEMMGLSLNFLGGNAFIWKIKHNVIHHTYTNVDGVDDDIAKMPLIRQCSSQKWMPAHRYQHWYSLGIYALSSFLWIMLMDYMKYFSKKVYTTPIHKIPVREHIIFWVSKILYIAFYIALPIYMVGWLPWLVGFFVMHGTMGLALAIVFQLAHVVEDVSFVDAHAPAVKIDEEWAVHQIRTTADFATDNKLISWLLGGLNFQIEHHLFPKISHVHYPAIRAIVKDVCDEHGLRHVDYPTMSSAINSHFRFMKSLGKNETQVLA